MAVITGAGGGIGRAMAMAFAREGAKLLLTDLDQREGEKTLERVKEKGGTASFFRMDVSKSDEVKEMVDLVIEKYGRIDILCNNAGIFVNGTVVDTAEDTFDKIIAVNLKGVFLGCKYAIPRMIEQGGGSIVNTASVNGIVGLYNAAAYDASKGGVVLLTKETALDFGYLNIRVNCICPGVTDTAMVRSIPKNLSMSEKEAEEYLAEDVKLNAAFKRMIRPEEVAEVALFLASDQASGVTGSAYTVDGGFTAI